MCLLIFLDIMGYRFHGYRYISCRIRTKNVVVTGVSVTCEKYYNSIEIYQFIRKLKYSIIQIII